MILDAAKHKLALRTSSMLTDSFRRMYRPASAMIRPEKVIRVLKRAGVEFVVMGTHGISGWREEPRATQDVDVLIRRGQQRKAILAIRQAFPDLKVKDEPIVTRFSDPETRLVVIDLIKEKTALFEETFRNSVKVGKSHAVPDLEMALVTKFAAMISPIRREDKRLVDGGDFVNIVLTNMGSLDLDKLRRLGELVYPGGGDEIVRYIHDIRAGRSLRL